MDLKKTGNFISCARKAKNLTQKELADRLHVSDRAVSKWERGVGFPDVSILTELADALDVTVTELLQGERASDRLSLGNRDDAELSSAELTVREAVNTLYEQTRMKAKKNRMQILSAVLVIALLVGGAGLGLKKLGEHQILRPPEITCEILQGRGDVDFAGELLVDKANNGVYDYTCRYEIDRYGQVRLAERKMWRSYDDTVPPDVYNNLQNLHTGQLTSVWALDSGWLAEYHGTLNGTLTLIETDAMCSPVFTMENSYEHNMGLTTAFVDEDMLHAVSYNSDEQRIYVTSVNKAENTQVSGSFSYETLSGTYDSERRVGGFLFNGRNMWVKKGILYFAETHYHGGGTVVFAAYDLEKNEPVVFREMRDSHLVMVDQNLEEGKVSVLVNPMNYQPLQLLELDAWTMEVLNTKYLELPHEYLSRQDEREHAGYLFDVDMNTDTVLVKVPEVFSETRLREQKDASQILVLYDRKTGEMIWRARLTMDVNYDIYGVKLSEEEIK